MKVETIAQRLKQLIDSSNYSRIDIASMAGVSKQTLYKYENGIITNIPSDKIENLAKVLGTTPAYLMGWDQDLIDEQAEIEKDKNEYFDKYEAEFKEFMDELFELSLTSDELNEVSNYAKYIKSKRKE